MAEWKECTLGDVLTFQRGHDLPKTKMSGEGYAVAGSNGIIGYHSEHTTNAPAITIGRSGNVGNPYIYYEAIWAHNTTLYVKEFKEANPEFVYYFLKTMDLGSYAGGSAVPTLNRNHIHTLPIRFPDIHTQKNIANILRIFDAKIETNEAINRNLEAQAKAVFTSWFVNFECFDEPMKESPIGYEIPESLELVQVGDLNPILETGRRPKGGAVTEGIPSVGAESVKGLGKVNLNSNKYIPVDFASKQKTGKVNGYELMIYKDGGKPGEFQPHFSMFGEGYPFTDFFINEHVFKLDFGNRGFNELAYFYFQTDYVMNWLESNGGKAAIPGINQAVVKGIWILNPDHLKVKEYCEWVQPIFTQILKNCYSNVRLADLRDALLPKLMSGELDVSDLDI